jgi:hypothetical protein
VSVKDRWIGPREQVLNVSIACWYIGLVSWCSCVTTWLKPLSLLQGCCEGERMRWPKATVGPVCLWSSRLLPGVGAYFVLMGTSEMLPTWIMWDVWSGTLRGSSMESVWHINRVVHQFESPWLSDMSTAYLWLLSCSNLMNLIWLMQLLLWYFNLIVCNSYMIRVGCTFLLKWSD